MPSLGSDHTTRSANHFAFWENCGNCGELWRAVESCGELYSSSVLLISKSFHVTEAAKTRSAT